MKNLREYSKKIIQQMIELWFVGAKFGMVVVGVESVTNVVVMFVPNCAASVSIHLPELFAYVGAPVAGGILGYLLKSAFENREKIKNNPDYEAPSYADSDIEVDKFDYNN